MNNLGQLCREFALGLTTHQLFWVILCHLPEKERRKEIEEIVEEMKERDKGERKMK